MSAEERNIDLICSVLNWSRVQYIELVLDLAERFINQYTVDRELARSIFLSREFWRKWDFHMRHTNGFFISRYSLRSLTPPLSFEIISGLKDAFEAMHSPEKVKIQLSAEQIEEAEMMTVERLFIESQEKNQNRKMDPL